jgi:hypothetical protein
VTAGIIEPLVARVLRRPEPEEELAALQNLGATHDQDDSVKTHMAEVGVIPAVLMHVKPKDCNSTRLATAVVLNLAIESEERKVMLYELKACEAVRPPHPTPPCVSVSSACWSRHGNGWHWILCSVVGLLTVDASVDAFPSCSWRSVWQCRMTSFRALCSTL